MTLLNRSLAPINQKIWDFLDEEAANLLQLKLTGRKIIDFIGPQGSEFAAVNTGKLTPVESDINGIKLSKREVIQLLEIKVPFQLKLEELEAISRGAEDVDVDNLLEAANKIINLEDGAVYKGLPGIMKGISDIAEFTIDCGDKENFIHSIITGINNLKNAGVEGGFALVLSESLYKTVFSLPDEGYPYNRRLADLDVTEILSTPVLEKGGFLLSTRGGDFQLITGQDISIGYEGKSSDSLNLFLAESFVTRMITPEAAVILE